MHVGNWLYLFRELAKANVNALVLRRIVRASRNGNQLCKPTKWRESKTTAAAINSNQHSAAQRRQ